ncbi:RnfH family protein [Pseudoxanthomonas koreensis]|uniref:RnfH family protein n=1 Tax=Pseudoxanthomonas koreensis TaxID=266061 RepID=UPI001391F731|nr:RnfH family protein [Pseudoxanthomonas koreensis]KAF1697669.1 RnfH family protein [Pseudoxanthomonas koreensis]
MSALRVRVVLAWPHRFLERELVLDAGATVADAVRHAALGHDGEVAGYAVFGNAADASTPLRDGDRVELLRPLQADPKDARRRRAARQRGG